MADCRRHALRRPTHALALPDLRLRFGAIFAVVMNLSLQRRVQTLVDFYQHVQVTRMQGIPLLNVALRVEAVSFEWSQTSTKEEGNIAEGVLITPWFMSLLRLPAQILPHSQCIGRSFARHFGTEQFDFIGAHADEVGYYETCALFSPMVEFPTQALAHETAQAALMLTRLTPDTTHAPATTASVPARRDFLLGRLSKSGAGSRP